LAQLVHKEFKDLLAQLDLQARKATKDLLARQARYQLSLDRQVLPAHKVYKV
jgi:hypothetical protein